MTKKDFIAIAAALKAHKASKELCTDIARTMQAANPAFRWSIFMEACGHP